LWTDVISVLVLAEPQGTAINKPQN
jgi:hypothetical protein